MGVPVLVMGRSGSGKTYSLKNFTKDEVGVISVEKGRLPFKSDIKVVKIPKFSKNPDGTDCNSYSQMNRAKYSWLLNAIKSSKIKTLVIDDSQYLLVNEMFDRSGEKGYEKYTDIAKNFQQLVHFINEEAPEDTIVYFLHHSETDSNTGREKCKTIGKMLEEKLVIEGMFDVVLYCADHKFHTQSNEISTAKTPEGMFDALEIENDLKAVDKAIREYWGINKEETKK